MHLSDYFDSKSIVCHGQFWSLDQISTQKSNALVYCQNKHYLNIAMQNNNISAVIIKPEYIDNISSKNIGIVVSSDPRMTFFEFYNFLNKKDNLYPISGEIGISKTSSIHDSAIISKNSYIGNHVTIRPNAVINDNVIIEDHTYIGENTVIGSEGLITVRNKDGTIINIPHAGGVHIHNGCQILAGAVIAKSLFSQYTTIMPNSQIGIMANIGHGVLVGSNCTISSNCVVAGRTKLGSDVWMGASSVISQGLTIGDHVQMKVGSIVIEDLTNFSVVSGNFALSHRVNIEKYLKSKI